MPTVNSNVKLITSNQAPTTSNLAKGEMAFGQVAGINSIYGNTGNGIIKIEFTAGGEPIIYFANENALSTFIEGDDVPTSGWYAAIADTVYEQPTESYVQFDLGSPTPLGNYINSVSFSNRQQVGDYPLGGAWSITAVSGDEYNINLEAGANSGSLKVTVDAYIDFFGMPDNNPPEMDVSYIAETETKTNTIEGVYDSGSRKMKWQGSFTIDSTGNQTLGCWVSIMRYYENDSPTLQGTIKFEAIDG